MNSVCDCKSRKFSYSGKYAMFYAIWYPLYDLKIVKKKHGGMLLLVKLQGFSQQLY